MKTLGFAMEQGQANFLMMSLKDTSSCPTGFQLGYTTGQSCSK